MNYGLYLSAAGAMSNMHKLDVYANNLANIETVGFKPNTVYFKERAPERLEDMHPGVDPQFMLERLGGNIFVNESSIDVSQGDLRPTGNDLDLAIQGDGFFVLRGGSGPDAQPVRLTRDGRLTVNADGRLINATSGLPVLGQDNQPITLNPNEKVEIKTDGSIEQSGSTVAQLRVVTVDEPHALRKVGDSVYEPSQQQGQSLRAADGAVRQGFLESSGTNPMKTLSTLIAASKSAAGNAKMMQYHDHLMGQAVNTFGRVA